MKIGEDQVNYRQTAIVVSIQLMVKPKMSSQVECVPCLKYVFSAEIQQFALLLFII